MATYPTTAQLQKQANTLAGQQLTAAEAPINQQAKLAQQQADAHGQAIQGFATALAGVLKNIQPTVNQAYGDAASRDAVFAKGFSDAMAAKTQGAANDTNSFLQNVVHAPASQQLSAAPQTAGGDVAYGLGGYIPATDLSREGAAFSAAAAQLPGIAQLQGLQDYTSNVFAGRDQQKTFQDQIAALAAQRPGLESDAYQQLLNAQNQTRATDFNQALGITSALGYVTPQAAKLLGIKPGTKTASAKADAAATAAAVAKAGAPNAALSKVFTYVVDSYGNAIRDAKGQIIPVPSSAGQPKVNVALSKAYRVLVDNSGNLITKNGKPIPLPTPPGTAKTKFTASQVQTYSGKAYTVATDFHDGYDYMQNGATKHQNPQSYQAALRQMKRQGIPVSIAKATLNSVYKPGELGRPPKYTTVKPTGSLGLTAKVPTS